METFATIPLTPISYFGSVCSRQTRQHSPDCAQAPREKTTAFDKGSSGLQSNTDAESSAKTQTMIRVLKTLHFFLFFPLLCCPRGRGTFLELCPHWLRQGSCRGCWDTVCKHSNHVHATTWRASHRPDLNLPTWEAGASLRGAKSFPNTM